MKTNQNSQTCLVEWLLESRSAFDILVGDRNRFPGDTIFVDKPFLDREFESAFSKRMGSFPLEVTSKLLQRVALRYARRLADKEADQLDIAANGLKNAWFQPLFAEVTTLIPVRHLARKLYRRNCDKVFAIEVSKTDFTAINAWRSNELEPFYLACELRRLGAKVCIRMDVLESSHLRFSLSGTWLRKWKSQFRRDAAFSSVLCRSQMRRDDFVSRECGTNRRFRPSLFSLLKSRQVGREPFTLQLGENKPIDGLPAYSVPIEDARLLPAFLQLMSPATSFLRDWFRAKLKGRQVRTAHVADHASLESGLFSAEVVRQGGKVHLWPHSANVVHKDVHEVDDTARITLAARSSASVWAEKFGADRTVIDVRSILPAASRCPEYDSTSPLHVVLFAGAHTLQRAPFFDLEAHGNSWKTVLSGIQSSTANLTIKHKSKWETRDWIAGHSDDGAQLHFTRTHATKLDRPNMVFMSISLTSTAIFEGIARGIPGIVVRDVPVNETPYYDPEYIPCILSNSISTVLKSLETREAWEDLQRKQMEWFAKETN